jgi:bifunctional non-homologous end joining protein LigD
MKGRRGSSCQPIPAPDASSAATRRLRGQCAATRKFVAPFEQGEIGPDLFGAACGMALKGLVSKHRDRAYRGGPCRHWVKVKNPDSPAMRRAADVDWSR